MASKAKIFKYTSALVLTLLIILIGLIHYMDGMMTLDAKQTHDFAIAHSYLEEDEVISQGYHVFILKSKTIDSNKLSLVFVHGAPGSWDAYKSFFEDNEFSNNYNLVVYDRPGYGQSKGMAMTSLENQKKVLIDVIHHCQLNHVVLVSHSYGGPIAAMAAKEAHADGLMLMAPAISPDDEKTFWFAWFSIWKASRWILPYSMQVAGQEKLYHAAELSKFVNDYKDITCPILYIQSLDDALVPGPGNIKFVENNFPLQRLEKIIYKDKGHLFLFTEPDMVKKELKSFLMECKKEKD